MYLPLVFYISLRYMFRKAKDSFSYFVSWFSVIGMTLGVMSLVTVLSVMNSFEHEMENNTLSLIPQALLTNLDGRLNPKSVPSSLPETISDVIRVSPLITGDVVLQSKCNVAVGVMLSINQVDYEPLLSYLIDTDYNDLQNGQYRVILGDDLAIMLGVKNGDIIRIISPSASQFTPMGRIPSQRLFTVIGTFAANSEVDSYLLLVNQHDASKLMRYPAGYITGWRLWLRKPLAVNELTSKTLPDGLIWRDWREYKGDLFQAVKMEKNVMSLLLSLIIVVASFNITTSLGLLVIEKRTEIAILQIHGLTRRQIILIFIIYGTIVGISGALLGSGLGILLSRQLCNIIPVLETLPVFIDPVQIMIIIILAIFMASIATIYPSWHAAATYNPIQALRNE